MTAYNRWTLIAGIVAAVLVGGVVSYFASPAPDGLEKTEESLGAGASPHQAVEVPAVAFREYNLKWLGQGFWSNAVAGVTGAMVVLAIVLGVGCLLKRGRARHAAGGGPAPTKS
jgi:hypothetical protein